MCKDIFSARNFWRKIVQALDKDDALSNGGYFEKSALYVYAFKSDVYFRLKASIDH